MEVKRKEMRGIVNLLLFKRENKTFFFFKRVTQFMFITEKLEKFKGKKLYCYYLTPLLASLCVPMCKILRLFIT